MKQEEENPALRLKETFSEPKFVSSKVGSASQKRVRPSSIATADSRLPWKYFDEVEYIAKTKVQPGEDAYARNKFNQAASDRLRSNRDIPDTRHSRFAAFIYNPEIFFNLFES